MSIERAVERVVREHPDLVAWTRERRPAAWGRLAAQGVLAFRADAGRAPDDGERRAIWARLWEAVQSAAKQRSEGCDSCGIPLDPRAHAICAVCEGMRLCISCARAHLCTAECAERGCLAGLCVKLVSDGVVSDAFGIP